MKCATWSNLHFALLLLLLSQLPGGCQAADDSNETTNEFIGVEDEDPLIRVIVGFDSPEDKETYYLNRENDSTTYYAGEGTRTTTNQHRNRYKFKRGDAVAMTIRTSELADIEADPLVSSVQKDSKMYQYQFSEEILPPGISMVQADTTAIPLPTFSGDCQDPSSFKICVVDSGLMVGHEDIPFTVNSSSIVGQVFGLPDSYTWYHVTAAASHGTHVTGIMLAEAGNGVGVVGTIGDHVGICLLVARVFDESGNQVTSVVTEAVEWCAENGARVINLSLGSNDNIDKNTQRVYDGLADDGILMVAAAGNDGSPAYSYPASLDSVVSVAAIHENNTVASFSQFNKFVNLAAPGVEVLSTVTGNGFYLPSIDFTMAPGLMQYSKDVPEDLYDISIELSNCGLAFDVCEDAFGKVCVIERGETYFSEKALNCQEGGGVIALIFNNEEGVYYGSLLTDAPDVDIPVFSVSQENGAILLQEIGGTVVISKEISSYEHQDGTSMATPHVSGVAAKIWAARPNCTNDQIRTALEETAFDLGEPGQDDYYGRGLVQAEAAYNYLIDQFDPPCGIIEPTEPSCLTNFAPCVADEDCCSGRCFMMAVGASSVCRSSPKYTKNKLVGTTRGGAAGSEHRDLLEETAYQQPPQRFRGSASNQRQHEELQEVQVRNEGIMPQRRHSGELARTTN